MTNIVTTAYCACLLCCGDHADGITASGTTPRPGITAAMNGVPFGTRVYIHEMRKTVIVEDRMAKRFTGRLDLYFASHEDARRYGIRTNTVQLFRPYGNTTPSN